MPPEHACVVCLIVSLARVGSKTSLHRKHVSNAYRLSGSGGTSPHRKHVSNAQGYVPHAHVVCLSLVWLGSGVKPRPTTSTRRLHKNLSRTHASFALDNYGSGRE